MAVCASPTGPPSRGQAAPDFSEGCNFDRSSPRLIVTTARQNVRYWHKADIPSCTMSAFGGRADITFCAAHVCF